MHVKCCAAFCSRIYDRFYIILRHPLPIGTHVSVEHVGRLMRWMISKKLQTRTTPIRSSKIAIEIVLICMTMSCCNAVRVAGAIVREEIIAAIVGRVTIVVTASVTACDVAVHMVLVDAVVIVVV